MSELKGKIGYIAPATFRNPSDWNVLLPPGMGIVAVTLNVKAHTQDPEREFGKPVVASSPAILWWAIKTMGIRAPIEHFGRLARIPLTS